MSKKITSFVTALLLGLLLIANTYLYLVLGVALGLGKGNSWFVYLMFVSPVMGIIEIAGAALIFKKANVSKILFIIPLAFYLLVSFYLILSGLFSWWLILLSAVGVVLGILALVFAFLIKKEKREIVGSLEITKEIKDINKEDKEMLKNLQENK